MSIEENIRMAEEHLKAGGQRELDRLLARIASDTSLAQLRHRLLNLVGPRDPVVTREALEAAAGYRRGIPPCGPRGGRRAV